MTFYASKTPNADPCQGSALWIIKAVSTTEDNFSAQSYVSGASRTIAPH